MSKVEQSPDNAAYEKLLAAEKAAMSKRYIINVAFANDNEPRDIFVGDNNGGDYLITRGKDVTVPKSVLEKLDHAVVGVPEVDPDDPTKTVVVQRKRFPYSLIGEAR